MNCEYLAWCCPKCGYWQNREIRFNGEKSLGEKYKKVSLKCLRCNKSTKLKLSNKFGLNVIGRFYNTTKECSAEIRLKNVPEEFRSQVCQ